MSSRTDRRGSALAAAALAGVVVLLGSGPAWAEPSGRIQEVASSPGQVQFILSAEGLAEGQSIDPESVVVRVDGLEAATTATGLNDAAAAPVRRTVMLALDSSGSMNEFGALQRAKDAANAYLASLPRDVRAGLVSFADTAVVEVEPTADRAAVARAVDGLVAEGSTALNDAVVLSVDQLGADGSRNVVLLSDGVDEGSTASAKSARKRLARSGVVLDAVSLGKGSQQRALAAYAKAGNGSLVTATDADSLTAAFESAARSVDTQLAVVAETPPGVSEGTAELSVTALVGEQPISDSVAAIIAPLNPSAVAAESQYGPVPVPEREPGSSTGPGSCPWRSAPCSSPSPRSARWPSGPWT